MTRTVEERLLPAIVEGNALFFRENYIKLPIVSLT